MGNQGSYTQVTAVKGHVRTTQCSPRHSPHEGARQKSCVVARTKQGHRDVCTSV